MNFDRYRVKPGKRVKLTKRDPNDRALFEGSKEDAAIRTLELVDELEELQEVLYAESKQKLLIVLQGMDTAGKDGTIRLVFDGVNPSGVKVAPFKKPTDDELSRDFLWRVHQKVPARGEIVIFNRSHYEDVLVVRVHSLVPKRIWKTRYQQIVDFEKLLTDTNTRILKFFLHIDRNEQKERLQARLAEPDKQWKFNMQDVAERAHWDAYTKAYEAALSKTSTESAPWYIIPSNMKWYRSYVIASIVVETLKGMKIRHPDPDPALASVVID
ncbi:MAG TPA: polyphosphate kinase 2 family protein [Thermoanaerobaculia bacterium]|nr:polyphosphate kinase 2 family protein [Thermoanaerobaculia bacterium]